MAGMSELLGDPWPRLRASSINEFLDSREGNDFVRFVNQYVFVNHTCRSKYSDFLFENEHTQLATLISC